MFNEDSQAHALHGTVSTEAASDVVEITYEAGFCIGIASVRAGYPEHSLQGLCLSCVDRGKHCSTLEYLASLFIIMGR